MKNRIKKSFDRIEIPNSLKKKVMIRTIEKEKSWKLRLGFVLPVLLVFLLATFTVVYAKEIKTWYASVILKNGNKSKISENIQFKKIPATALKTDLYDYMIEMNYEKVENMLGFPILKSKSADPIVYYSTSLNPDKSIGRVELWIPDMLELSKEKDFSLAADVLNEGAFIGLVDPYMEGEDPFGGSEVKEQYTSPQLGVLVSIKTSDVEGRTETVFVYDDVYYRLIGHNVTFEDIKEVIETLEF